MERELPNITWWVLWNWTVAQPIPPQKNPFLQSDLECCSIYLVPLSEAIQVAATWIHSIWQLLELIQKIQISKLAPLCDRSQCVFSSVKELQMCANNGMLAAFCFETGRSLFQHFWSKSSSDLWVYVLGRCGIGHVFVPITSQGKQTFQVISDQQVFHILKSKKNKLGELGRWVYFAKIHSQKYTLAKLEGLHCKYLWNESCRSYLILYELIYDIWKEILLKWKRQRQRQRQMLLKWKIAAADHLSVSTVRLNRSPGVRSRQLSCRQNKSKLPTFAFEKIANR